MTPARGVAAVRLLWGVLLVAAPRAALVAARARDERNSPRARGVVIVLGVRNVVQSVIELARPTRAVLLAAATVDAIHAMTFLGLSALGAHARWRRAAQLNVATATGFCAGTAWAASR